ncbi:MAG: creatininase family protein [Saprospiraceae bacterium]|nr:creatininase family protein [Saprospiraceae bacterium]
MSTTPTEVCLERMLPYQIQARMQHMPIVYVPLGAIEYHGLHLPIGLDGFTAHALCEHAARQVGGMVMPTNYYGMTGSIGHHPWTILVDDESEFEAILWTTLRRLQDFGVKLSVLFTGHFGRRQLASLEALEERWNQENQEMRVLFLAINRCPAAKLQGDHGAIFETSLLAQLHPSLVQLDRLPSVKDQPANDPNGDSWGPHRRDQSNVLFGILGDDPRLYDPAEAKDLLDTLQTWVHARVSDAYQNLER